MFKTNRQAAEPNGPRVAWQSPGFCRRQRLGFDLTEI